MAFEVKQMATYYSNNWRFKNVLGLSSIAVLFPNELRQEGGALKTIVRFPVMTEVTPQENWSQEEGFDEKDATEEMVQLQLDQNFTSLTKIDKANVPAWWQTWARGKMDTINRQEARVLDNYVLKQIASGITNNITGPQITKENFVATIKKIGKELEKNNAKAEDAIFFISSDVSAVIMNSNIQAGTTTIENTSAVITRIFNRYSVVEAPVDDYGYQIIAVIPQAFAWAAALHTPLTAGEYDQGKWFGQIFVIINRFFAGKVILPEHIIGYKIESQPAPALSTIITTTVLGELANGEDATVLAGMEAKNPNAVGKAKIKNNDGTGKATFEPVDPASYSGTVDTTYTITAG